MPNHLNICLDDDIYAWLQEQYRNEPSTLINAVLRDVFERTTCPGLEADPVCLQIANNLVDLVDPETGGNILPEISTLRHRLMNELGYMMPPIRVLDSLHKKPGEFEILIHGNSIDTGTVAKQRNPVATIISHLEKTLITHSDLIVSLVNLAQYRSKVSQEAPEILQHLTETGLSIFEQRAILANLIRDRVSIKDIVFVFERLADYAQASHNPTVLSERLQHSLKGHGAF